MELGRIPWVQLEHAYGSAGDIPGLLEEAQNASSSGYYTDEPWFSLWSALCHQMSTYSASFAAVPFLVEIAQSRPEAERFDAVHLATAIHLYGFPPIHLQAPEYQDAIVLLKTLTDEMLEQETDEDKRVILRGGQLLFNGDRDQAEALWDEE